MTASRYEVQPIGTVESTLIDRATAPRQGTRSPDRPNPIGLHRVRIESIAGTRVRVSSLEALDGGAHRRALKRPLPSTINRWLSAISH